MTTLSIPIPPQLEAFVNEQVKKGRDANKAAVVRRALTFLKEEEALATVLKAQNEPTLKGNLRDLVKKIS